MARTSAANRLGPLGAVRAPWWLFVTAFPAVFLMLLLLGAFLQQQAGPAPLPAPAPGVLPL
jgi:hypothetical protein